MTSNIKMGNFFSKQIKPSICSEKQMILNYLNSLANEA